MRILLDQAGPISEAYSRVRWEDTPVGHPDGWTATLRTTVDMMLRSEFPMTLLWGPSYVLIYNHAYVQLIGDKHPYALGRTAEEIFPEVWDLVGPLMEGVRASGRPVYMQDEYVPLHRRGFLEDCWFTFCYSPVRNTAGEVEGVLDVATETTREVVFRRRMDILARLSLGIPEDAALDVIGETAVVMLRKETSDVAEVDLVPDDRDELPLHFATWDGTPIHVPVPTTAPVELALRLMPTPTVVVDEDFRSFLGLAAATIGQALDRAHAVAVQRRMNEVQRQMSEAFQRSLLPRQGGIGETEIAVRYRPAVEVAQLGGDWYDFFPLRDGGLGVVIGDVAGHDQRAAAAMAQVRNLVRGIALSIGDDAPSAVLESLERVLEISATDVVATAVVARVLPLEEGRMDVTWSNAGHPPPVVIDPDGTARLLTSEPDLLLGVDAHTSRHQHRTVLEPGATLVLYTDGLVESRAQTLDDGLDRLLDCLTGVQDHELEQLCDDMLATAPDSDDDVALLLLRS
ncbi:hypothetical protein EKO23_07585 [Nocardioides guangzhouensis]|uniref:PPM-type phosphatase domain-containing protein n=1 Tax=Nocardioides guangzhouensis TaxID=2497878 RepID=A0A4Q4ZF80_9ACTN|nr:SpoIIE family protein phosphatase [Nocardioides guangzhouensis]RYP86830.1 hypothetical protein EKO23_07585 [Nocardioides guangzhouensis]